MTVFLVTRPEPDCTSTCNHLAALDLVGEAVPLLHREALSPQLPEASRFGAMAVTSANALRTLDETRVLAAYTHLPLFAVGDRTAALGRQLGFAQVHNAGGALSDLALLLRAKLPPGSLFYPCGEERAGELEAMLPESLGPVRTVPVYRMAPTAVLPPLATLRLLGSHFAAALFYSVRTAEVFARLARDTLPPAAREHLVSLCISAKVAQVLVDNRFPRVALADAPSEDAMMALALSFSRERS